MADFGSTPRSAGGLPHDQASGSTFFRSATLQHNGNKIVASFSS